MSDEDVTTEEQAQEQQALEALSRDDLFDFEGRRVDLPRLNGYLYVQPLPFEIARDIIKESNAGQEEGDAANVDVAEYMDILLLYGVVDESGERVFTKEDADSGRFDSLPFDVGMNLAMEVLDISGLSGDGEEEIQGN